MRNSSSLDWLRFMHTPNDYRVSPYVLINLSLTYSTINEKKYKQKESSHFYKITHVFH